MLNMVRTLSEFKRLAKRNEVVIKNTGEMEESSDNIGVEITLKELDMVVAAESKEESLVVIGSNQGIYKNETVFRESL